MTLGLSIIVPCYNEEARLLLFREEWVSFFSRYRDRLEKAFSSIELIFVNDGSTDATESLLSNLQSELLSTYGAPLCYVNKYSLPHNQGKGAAVREGLLRAQGDWVLMTDCDLSSPLREIFKLREANADLAFGSRALAQSRITKYQKGLRPWLGRIFNAFMRFMTGLPFRDTQCGFKLIRGTLAKRIGEGLRENRFAFDVEMLLLAGSEHALLKEVPVEWAHREPSRVSPLKDGIHMAFKVLEFAVRYPRYRAVETSEASAVTAKL